MAHNQAAAEQGPGVAHARAATMRNILLVIMLALLLAGLDLPTDRAARHYSVIVDDSISMTARVSGTMSAQRSMFMP